MTTYLYLLSIGLAAPTIVGLLARLWDTAVQRASRTATGRTPQAPVPQAEWQAALANHVVLQEKDQEIGIILVHGIGEQRRFQHLDSQLRDLLRALHGLKDAGDVGEVSVDIAGSGAAAFSAEHDTWTSGPQSSVTIVVKHRLNSKHQSNGAWQTARLMVHEVWWADVNEPYSLAKQFRFWLWGLAMWAVPARPQSNLGSAARVAPPVVEGRSWLWDRLRLWAVGVFFMLLGYSVGLVSFLASRLFNLQMPKLLRTISNYISAVKLYNQQQRYGPGLFWKREEFLDSIDEPPRVSIRRRMIRTISDVATNGYDRWYVLAHSQGTVVAFNGLMETAYAWPGYLDETRWQVLKDSRMAGPAVPPVQPRPPFMPRRPGWAKPDEIAYRSRIFKHFRGFLTYGSPLQKFAGLWPALVPIGRDRVFGNDIPWVNVYDPLDPVSGQLDAYKRQPAACCPQPVDFGYTAHWVLLAAHLHYLTRRKPSAGQTADDVATRTIRWILTDHAGAFQPPPLTAWGTWFSPGSWQAWVRRQCAYLSWIAAALLLLVLGAVVWRLPADEIVAAFWATWATVVGAPSGGRGP